MDGVTMEERVYEALGAVEALETAEEREACLRRMAEAVARELRAREIDRQHRAGRSPEQAVRMTDALMTVSKAKGRADATKGPEDRAAFRRALTDSLATGDEIRAETASTAEWAAHWRASAAERRARAAARA